MKIWEEKISIRYWGYENIRESIVFSAGKYKVFSPKK